ncbi:MAG: flagellar biosynthetic protein FliO [Deltaproteobacteria bacterium]|nr:flagellar biosynthetic protein FliO [Deltaproteobacteria bacterium]
MNYSPDLVAPAVKMLLVFGILLSILVIGLYFMKKAMGRRVGSSKGNVIRVLASHYVGVKKNISLVEIPGAVLVLGITNDRINLLAKIDDTETVKQVSSPEDEPVGWSFSEHFQKLSSLYRKNRG